MSIYKKDHQAFIIDLIHHFPEIKEEVLDEDYIGLITLQISCFKRFTQEAIDMNNPKTINRCFQFVEDNLDQVVFRIENSMIISYLGKLDFSKNPNTEKLLPKRLIEILKELRMQS